MCFLSELQQVRILTDWFPAMGTMRTFWLLWEFFENISKFWTGEQIKLYSEIPTLKILEQILDVFADHV